MENINTTNIDEHGILAMTSVMLYEIKIRSFLLWCFKKYGKQMKFKHHDTIFKVSAISELGYVTGMDNNGNEIHLHPREVIKKLPSKAIKFFIDNWLND